jgi:hypothetical protein
MSEMLDHVSARTTLDVYSHAPLASKASEALVVLVAAPKKDCSSSRSAASGSSGRKP